MSHVVLAHVVLVGIGGFLGSIGRFVLSGFVHRLTPYVGIPFGTFVVNMVGCFLIGLLNGLADSRQMFGADIRVFLFIGVLGGFTTYSTFGHETLVLLRDAEVFKAAASVVMHVIAGLGVVWLGDFLGRLG